MYLQFSILAFTFALVRGEAPRYNTRQFEKLETAPYSYSGWRPSGPEFRIPEPHRVYGPPPQQLYQAPRAPAQEYAPPQQSFGAPSQEYGPPAQEYGPPAQEYGPPPQEYGPPPQEYGPPEEGTTTVEPEGTTTELPTTTEGNDLEAEELGSGDNGNESEQLVNGDEGVYYIYHPSGLLQRVVYATKDDLEKMAFSAKLKYENVEPIKGPIFTYDPKTLVFRKL